MGGGVRELTLHLGPAAPNTESSTLGLYPNVSDQVTDLCNTLFSGQFTSYSTTTQMTTAINAAVASALAAALIGYAKVGVGAVSGRPASPGQIMFWYDPAVPGTLYFYTGTTWRTASIV